VLLLGMKTGWSEAAILSMPVVRFNFYVDCLLTENQDEQ